jgi:hypothetical protein
MALQVYYLGMCPLKIKMTKTTLGKNDDRRTKEFEHHKKNEQRGKARTFDLFLLEAPKKWSYAK